VLQHPLPLVREPPPLPQQAADQVAVDRQAAGPVAADAETGAR
jgi:hypothetical protein